jgi:hypothetical protein
VYKDKGCGFLEAVYQECLEIELEYERFILTLTRRVILHRRNLLVLWGSINPENHESFSIIFIYFVCLVYFVG